MTKRMTSIAMMVVLAISLTASSVMAQKGPSGFAPVGIYTGTESDAGTCILISDMCYGNTFTLTSHGEWESYHLTVSVNYSRSQFVPNNFVVTGGTWSMVVIRGNQYAGTLYGDIRTGSLSMVSDNNGGQPSKRVQVTLTTNGGFGLFEGRKSREISGVYDMITDLRSEQTSGVASFNF